MTHPAQTVRSVNRRRAWRVAALARYASGELGNQATLTDLLVPLNVARDHVGALLLHVPQNLEEQADTQGRSAEAV